MSKERTITIHLTDSDSGIVAQPSQIEVKRGDFVLWDRSALKAEPVIVDFLVLPSPANGRFVIDTRGNMGLVMNNSGKAYTYYAYYASQLLGGTPPPPPNPPVIIIMDDYPA